MSRYIDAEKIEGFLQWRIDTEKRKLKRGDISKCCALEQFKKFIEDQPTADVEEVRHGYWSHIRNVVLDEIGTCSVCGERRDVDSYCSNCGAKMDERCKTMLDEHMKEIAKMHARKDENQFYESLRWCGWEDSQIAEMWKYAQKGGEKNGESIQSE